MTRRYFLSVALAACAASGALAAPAPKPWSIPTCALVNGLPSVSYTRDEGLTYATSNGFLPIGQASFGVAALQQTDTLLAEYRGTVYRSVDAGCTWKAWTGVPVSGLRMVAGAGSEAYAWGFFPGPAVFRLDGRTSPRNRAVRLADLPADALVVAVDAATGTKVRAAAADGFLYDWSETTGRWAAVGTRAPVNALTYFAAIDPANLDHAVFGMATDGVVVTFDGGTTWTHAAGLSSTAGPRNAFNGVISPASGQVVYVVSLDLNEADAGAPSQGRHVYRSQDGGVTFTPVVDANPDVTIVNGPTMAAHPTDPDVVYWPFGSKSFDPNGIRLYRYDHAAGAVTWQTNHDRFEIRSLAFHPRDPSIVYAGFEGE